MDKGIPYIDEIIPIIVPLVNRQKAYTNDRRRLQKLYTCGESIATKNNFTEDDIFEEIRKYRQAKYLKSHPQTPS
jgi:hypothetical protein